jgi:hypothetical protein
MYQTPVARILIEKFKEGEFGEKSEKRLEMEFPTETGVWVKDHVNFENFYKEFHAELYQFCEKESKLPKNSSDLYYGIKRFWENKELKNKYSHYRKHFPDQFIGGQYCILPISGLEYLIESSCIKIQETPNGDIAPICT